MNDKIKDIIETNSDKNGCCSLSNFPKVKNFTENQINFVCYAINQYGCGEHPWADRNSFSHCDYTYAMECIQKAIDSHNLKPEGLDIANEVKNELS